MKYISDAKINEPSFIQNNASWETWYNNVVELEGLTGESVGVNKETSLQDLKSKYTYLNNLLKKQLT